MELYILFTAYYIVHYKGQYTHPGELEHKPAVELHHRLGNRCVFIFYINTLSLFNCLDI